MLLRTTVLMGGNLSVKTRWRYHRFLLAETAETMGVVPLPDYRWEWRFIYLILLFFAEHLFCIFYSTNRSRFVFLSFWFVGFRAFFRFHRAFFRFYRNQKSPHGRGAAEVSELS